MTESSIRLATADDIPDLLELEKECFKRCDRFKRSQFKYLIDLGAGYFYVYDSDGCINGYCYLSPRGRIYSIAARNSLGIGSKLIEVALTHYDYYHAEVRINNKNALHFFMKHGFKRVAIEENYYRDGMTAIRLELDMRQ